LLKEGLGDFNPSKNAQEGWGAGNRDLCFALRAESPGTSEEGGFLKHGDRISAIFFLALSFFVCGHAYTIGLGSFHQPGSGLLVFGAGMGVGLLALWLLIHSFIRREEHSDGTTEGSPLQKWRFFALCASLFIYALAVSYQGFLLPTFLFATFIFRLIKTEPWWRSVLTAALITIGNYLIFVTWLGLSLPKEPFPW
jgi:putative tricarboxylic transport membrane protein